MSPEGLLQLKKLKAHEHYLKAKINKGKTKIKTNIEPILNGDESCSSELSNKTDDAENVVTIGDDTTNTHNGGTDYDNKILDKLLNMTNKKSSEYLSLLKQLSDESKNNLRQ